MSRQLPEVDILFEDDDILVVHKPAGLGTQAPRQFDSLERRIRDYLSASSSYEVPYLGIPHRLDRCASGVMVFAKRKKAAQRLSRQFERREISKEYLARVAGRPEADEGCWRDTMRKVPDEPRAELVSADHADAKSAVLHFRVVSPPSLNTAEEPTKPRFAELAIRLETGRMHQIRLQCSVRGMPILGDRLYGSSVAFGPRVEHPREQHIALHAVSLEIEHPRSRERQSFAAPLPATWTLSDVGP